MAVHGRRRRWSILLFILIGPWIPVSNLPILRCVASPWPRFQALMLVLHIRYRIRKVGSQVLTIIPMLHLLVHSGHSRRRVGVR